jgi:uncharacterized protein (DUF885 family)
MHKAKDIAYALMLTVAIAGSPLNCALADSIADIVRDFDAYTHAQDPIRAADRGDLEAARRWPDNSPAAVAARKTGLLEFQRRLHSAPVPAPDTDAALNHALLVRRVDDALEGLRFDEERLPFMSGDGFYTTPDYAALNTRITDSASAEAWLARLEALPAYYTRETANMRRGVQTGFTQPRRTVERAIADVKAQLETPEDRSPLLAPFRSLPAAIPQGQRRRWETRGHELFSADVQPAQQALLTFFTNEYLPHARQDIGISSLPRGREYYAYLVRHHTTTGMTPEQVHELGLHEVARIRLRMDRVIAQTGFKGSFTEFLAFVRSDTRFYVSADQYGEKASEVAKRADFALPRWFGRLPRLPYGVLPIPAGLESSANGYLPGSPQRGVAGMVVYKPWMAGKMPTFGIAPWMLHEGVPGHHLQIALSQEVENLPEFRRADDVTAFVEGWGLYAERLGEEMGIYRDPYEQFGRLSLEMWRACRLVIDTGMHVMGWTREQAMDCLRQNSALAPAEIEFEVDRYIAWPGQALAYKIGELEIVRLRERAEQRLGARFDVRAFHDVVLAGGAMPLDLLGRRVDRWIESRRGAQTDATASLR